MAAIPAEETWLNWIWTTSRHFVEVTDIPEFAVISNRRAGSNTMAAENAVLAALKPLDPVLIQTEHSGHATVISRSLPEGSWIVVLGGDGTINEVANGIMGSDKVLVPFLGGTGSDYLKSTGKLSADSIISAFHSGRFALLDCVKTTFSGSERYFANIMEIGFGAGVMKRVNSLARRKGNPFTSSVMRELPGLKSYNLQIESVQFTGAVRSIEMVIANGRFFGGGMLASPDSVLDDGLLDIHLIKKISRTRLIMSFGKLGAGRYVDMNSVINFRTDRLKVAGDPAPVEADGEFLGYTPISIEIVPRSIRVLTAESVGKPESSRNADA